MAHVGKVESIVSDVFQSCEVRFKRRRQRSRTRACIGCAKIEIFPTPFRVQICNVVESISLRRFLNGQRFPFLDKRLCSFGHLALYLDWHLRSRSQPRRIDPYFRRPFALRHSSLFSRREFLVFFSPGPGKPHISSTYLGPTRNRGIGDRRVGNLVTGLRLSMSQLDVIACHSSFSGAGIDSARRYCRVGSVGPVPRSTNNPLSTNSFRSRWRVRRLTCGHSAWYSWMDSRPCSST